MEISKEQLFLAASKLEISKKQAEALWTLLEKNEENSRASSFSKWMFYFGALIIISAMTWLLNLSWEWLGGGAIFIISLLYALAFTWMGARLWNRPDLKIPAGLLITVAVCMIPLAIYGLETYLDIWPQERPDGAYKDFFYRVRSSWIFMELGTIFAGLIALRFFPFPFITAPIFFAAWFLAMDIVPLLFGNDYTVDQRAWTSLCFGLATLLIAYFLDREKREDFAFWGYLFGTLAFWIGLTALTWDRGEAIALIYFIVNLLLMILSILLKRKVLMGFGALGAFVYCSHLAYDIFKDSVLFPFVLSFIGLLIIFLGVLYQKNYQLLEKKIMEGMPTWMRKFF